MAQEIQTCHTSNLTLQSFTAAAHPELRCEHLHEESLRVDSVRTVNVVLRGVGAVLKPPRHLATPGVETKGDKQRRRQGHPREKHDKMSIDL